MQKKVILILAIVMPVVGVFIFNFFSQSYFDIPVYYQEEVPEGCDCGFVPVPYKVDSSTYFDSDEGSMIYPFISGDVKIFGFDQGNDFFRAEINKLGDEFVDEKEVKIYDFGLGSVTSEIPIVSKIIGLQMDPSIEKDLRECIFLIPDKEDNAVLIDHQNRIRGFYNLMDGDLTDSLIVETKILLHQKSHADKR